MFLHIITVYTCVIKNWLCLLINYIYFRYKDLDPYGESDIISSEYIESTNLVTLKESMSCGTVLKQLFNPFRLRHPTFLSSRIVAVEVLAFGKIQVHWSEEMGIFFNTQSGLTSLLMSERWQFPVTYKVGYSLYSCLRDGISL
jgi:hypothetical protein